MGLGWSGLDVVFVVGCEGGSSRDMYMVVLTPLWYRNAWDMICVSLLCRAL